jgi:hypothetical protein
MTKIIQLTREDVAKLRAEGKFEAISKALADGKLAEITGQPIRDVDELGDTGPEAQMWTLLQLQNAYKAKLYEKINEAGKRGLLADVLGSKGANNAEQE